MLKLYQKDFKNKTVQKKSEAIQKEDGEFYDIKAVSRSYDEEIRKKKKRRKVEKDNREAIPKQDQNWVKTLLSFEILWPF